MAVHIDRQLKNGSPSFKATRTEFRITEKYIIWGDTAADNCFNPILVRAFAGVPQYRDPNPDYALCLAIERNFSNHGPLSTEADITYSDNPDYTLEVDGDTVVTYDLMGRTENQPWCLDKIVTDRDNAAIGANNEGTMVYRPYCSITVEKLSSNIDTGVWAVTGTINDANWDDGTGVIWVQYSLLFLGCTIQSEGSNWKHTYQFLYHSNDHTVTWRNYSDRKDGTGKLRRYYDAADKTAIVYNEGNFALLDI